MCKTIYRLSAFDYQQMGGNPAGVVLEADTMSVADMLRMAKAIGYAETAFVMQSEHADYKVRFFTPEDEVDLCGHATIATFNLLRDLGWMTTGIYTQETKAGILEVAVYEAHVMMSQNKPYFGDIIERKDMLKCFSNLSETDLMDAPIQIVSTGLRDMIVPVRSLETLVHLKADLQAIHAISITYDVIGIHAFCLETYDGHDAHVRNFAPRYGIDEESATGTSNGALACYMKHYGMKPYGDTFIMEQGYCMDAPSLIQVSLNMKDEGVESVQVGGSARRI